MSTKSSAKERVGNLDTFVKVWVIYASMQNVNEQASSSMMTFSLCIIFVTFPGGKYHENIAGI